MVKNGVKPITLSSFDSSTLSSSFQLFTTITEPLFLCSIINNATVDVTVSFDGTNAHDYIQKSSRVPLNFQTNSQPNNKAALLATGTKVYLKGTAGTGDVYLSGWYNPQGV